MLLIFQAKRMDRLSTRPGQKRSTKKAAEKTNAPKMQAKMLKAAMPTKSLLATYA
jgi:hypothetical protein